MMINTLIRRRNRPALIVGAGLLAIWLWFVLGSDLPLLLVALGASAVGAWVLRRHRDVAAGLAVAIGTATAPTIACLIVMAGQDPHASDIVAVLTGCILVAPIPTLIAFAHWPPVLSRPINALIGSLILLLGNVPVLFAGDHGQGAPFLVVSLALSTGTVMIRQRRAAGSVLSGLPTIDGWTDLGSRILPDGSTVHRLLIGGGNAIAIVHADNAGQAALHRALHQAVSIATTLKIPAGRVQPVVLSPRKTGDLHRRVVNTGRAAAAAIVTGPSGLPAIAHAAPRRRFFTRRPLLAAAALPTARKGRPHANIPGRQHRNTQRGKHNHTGVNEIS